MAPEKREKLGPFYCLPLITSAIYHLTTDTEHWQAFRFLFARGCKLANGDRLRIANNPTPRKGSINFFNSIDKRFSTANALLR